MDLFVPLLHIPSSFVYGVRFYILLLSMLWDVHVVGLLVNNDKIISFLATF